MERLAGSQGIFALVMPLATGVDERAVLPTVRVPTMVIQHANDPFVLPASGKYIADHISGAKCVELPASPKVRRSLLVAFASFRSVPR
jgi:pimeloyl-ACP methyl ester carboxylesterase